MAMGISRAGFHHEAVIEYDKDACDTIRENQSLEVEPVVHWPLYQADVAKFDYGIIREGIDVLAGGPPCQPFSLGGKHRGHQDERNMFPEAVRGVRELRPRAFIFENVKGLLRESFAEYFEYIILQLNYPTITRKRDEEWRDHLSRLEQHHTRCWHDDLEYKVVFRLLNAANYGVPQKRERVFIVGFRADLNIDWSFPDSTHSQEALLWSQWITEEYWDIHQVPTKSRPEPPFRFRSKVNALRTRLIPPYDRPWVTVRDAISDLPDATNEQEAARFPNHRHIPGARPYPGHTGSPLDEPAKTLKAGDHGVPGGENTLAFANGQVRYFTVRECARLQTFPDNYVFHGSWTESMRQLGNAVPVNLSRVVAASVRERLERLDQR
jgi:DNA (cytosine-5)-methyltransferase 1